MICSKCGTGFTPLESRVLLPCADHGVTLCLCPAPGAYACEPCWRRDHPTGALVTAW